MENIMRQTTNCYDLSDNDDFIDWNNSSGEIINAESYVNSPNMIYNVLNDTHYQWCGPVIMIAEYFAKFTGTMHCSIMIVYQ